MPKRHQNKRYTPEFKIKVVETINSIYRRLLIFLMVKWYHTI